jgi:hypothetical protein
MDLKSELDKIIYYYNYHTSLVYEINAASTYFWNTQLQQLKQIENKENYIKLDVRKPNKHKKLGFNLFEKHELIGEHVPKMSLIYLLSLFEAFNKDFFQTLFKYKPELMRNKNKNLDYETILNFSDMNDLYDFVIQKEVDNLGYQDIDQIVEKLISMFKINLPDEFEFWDQLRENYYRRNIIVHNDGKISSPYLNKLERPSEDLNKELKCDDKYLWECSRNIQTYINFITEAIRKKFNIKPL